MADKTGSGSGFLFIIAGLGLASSLVVFLALRVFSQREARDPILATNDYEQVQQSAAIQTVRKVMAEEFVSAVVDCVSPQKLKNEILTEQQVAERVTAALESFSAPKNNGNAQSCLNNKNYAWTFTSPCKLTINRPPAWLGGTMNFGDINICGATVAASIHSALGGCARSASFADCLVSSVLANYDVQKEIGKITDVQR
jgi:hypothetical protein